MEDFTGIKFNGIHSSDLGLIRVSNGNRYEDILIPTPSITSTDVPGGEGQYYYGSNFKPRDFSLDFAFDNINDTQLRYIRNWCATKELAPLIFDEYPYKQYFARISSTPSFKFICFDGRNGRIYKGELSLKFTAYFPLAIVVEKDLDNYNYGDYPNKDDWFYSSRLIANYSDKLMDDEQETVGYEDTSHYFKICNPGDSETGYKLTIYKPSFYTNMLYTGVTSVTAYANIWTLDDVSEIETNLYDDEKDYRCYISGSYYSLNLEEGNYYCENTNLGITYTGALENRYFVTDNTDGKVFYKVYELISMTQKHSFTLQNSLSLNIGTQCYLNYQNASYPIQVDTIVGSAFNCYFTDTIPSMTLNSSMLSIGATTSNILSISIEDSEELLTASSYRYDLVFPAIYDTPIGELNLNQQVGLNEGYIEIDTNKQCISYYSDNSAIRTGLAGLLNNGSLFKIPIIDEDDRCKLLIETSGFNFTDNLSTLEYPYYYY